MKKIMVMGDTHKNFVAMDFLLPIMKECDYVVHLGDNEKDITKYKSELKDKIVSVKGNCDSMFADEEVLDVEGIKFLITHGNKYNVKNNLVNLTYAAIEKKCQVVLYGHTHKAEISNYVDDVDVCLINPGSLSANTVKKSYAYIVVSDGKVLPKIVEVNA